MKKNLHLLTLTALLLLGLSGCKSSAPQLDYKALAKASARMGVNIGPKDNHQLYLAAAQWMNTPYRAGGNTRRGTDCSGLVTQLYKQVYRIDLPRNSEQQMKESQRVGRRQLRQGDLVFFGSPASSKRVAHVGIFLKEGKFVHASTSSGVMVSHLDEKYYQRYWIRGGRMR